MAYYNVKPEDLSPAKQADYWDTLARLGKTKEWGEIALTCNPLEMWEEKGFGSFVKGFLRPKVDKLYNLKKGNDNYDAMAQMKQDILDACDAAFEEYGERISRLEAYIYGSNKQ